MRWTPALKQLLVIAMLSLGLSMSAQATSSGITYHGRLLEPDGTTPVSGVVQFKIELHSPGTSNCLMYAETQTQDLTSTSGIFALTIGSGTRYGYMGLTIDKVFTNGTSFDLSASTCVGSTTYNSVVGDPRELYVSFESPSMGAFEQMPVEDLNYAPLAIEAQQISGYQAPSLLRVDSTVVGGTSPLNNTQYTELLALMAGTSTHYSQSSTVTGTEIVTTSGNVTTPTVGSMWLDTATNTIKVYTSSGVETVPTSLSGSYLTAVAAGSGISVTTSGSTATVGIGTSAVTTAMLADGSVTTSKIASSSITGSLIDPAINITTSGNVRAGAASLNSLSLFNSQPTPDSVSLIAPGSAFTAYTLTLPTSAGANGQALTTDGAGVLHWSSLGIGTSMPSILSGQIYIGGAGNAPVAVTPTGDVSLTNAGALTVTAIQNVGVGTSAPTASGQVLRYDTTTTKYQPNFLSMADIRSTTMPGLTIFPTTSCTAAQVLNWSSLTDQFTCTNISISASNISGLGTAAALNVGVGSNSVVQLDGSAKLPAVDGSQLTNLNATNLSSGTVALARLPASVQFWQDGGSGRIGYVGGAVGIGTTTPTAYLQLPASPGTASSAPLKIGAGTLLSAPETGAVEFDGTNLYYTNSSGRQTLSAGTSTGPQTFAGDVTMNGTGTGLTVTNNESVGGSAAIGGSQTIYGNQSIGGTQTVAGLSTLTGGATSAGQVAITNNTASTSTTAGALTVVGGVGVGGNINAGGTVSAPSLLASTQVGIGTTSPLARLAITAGTNTIAPLLLNTGVNLTTPLVGAIEFDGTNLYYTNSSGRQTLSTGTSTGAQTFAGDVTMNGAGTGLTVTNNETVGGNVAIGGSQSITGNQTVSGTQTVTGLSTFTGGATSAGQISITNTTASTSTTNGALTVAGGVGVAGSVNANIFAAASGAATTPSHTFIGDLNSGLWQPSAGSLALSTNSSERMRIDSSGYIGIGTTAPARTLDVVGSSASTSLERLVNTSSTGYSSVLFADSTGTNAGFVGYANSGATNFAGKVYFGSSSASAKPVALIANGSEALSIDATGRVGIGTTTPGYKLDVAGQVNATAFSIDGTLLNAGSAGAWSISGSNLYNTSLSGNVGIGTDAPASSLSVNGGISAGSYAGIAAPTNGMIVSGSVGIGTTSPGVLLDVAGTMRATLVNVGSTVNISNSGNEFRMTDSTSNSFQTFYTNDGSTTAERMRITGTGNVGIGSTAPTSRLTLAAGTTALAPLQLTAGTNLSLPLAGAIEFDGTNLYYTNSSAARLTLATTVGGATTGNQTFSGTVGIGSTQPSTSTTTGALTVAGGVGVQGTVNAGIFAAASGSQTNPSHTFTSDLNTGMWSPATGAVALSTNSAERLRITSTGNVGIGSTAPGYKLDVAGQINSSTGFSVAGVPISASGSSAWSILSGNLYNTSLSGNVGIGTDAPASALSVNGGISAGSYYGAAAPANGLIVSGNVGIGTTAPSAPLEVAGKIYATDYVASAGGTLSAPTLRFIGDANTGIYHPTGNAVGIVNGGVEAMRIASGNVGIGTTVPLTKVQINDINSLSGVTDGHSYLNLANLSVATTDTQAQDVGAMLGLGGNRGTTKSIGIFGGVRGAKENSVDDNTAGYLGFYTLQNGIAFAERMRISSTGNVGIGTTSPGYKLDVAGSLNATSIYLNGSALASDLWGTNGTDVYRSSGKVGIGTTAPGALLEIGSAALSGAPSATAGGSLKVGGGVVFTDTATAASGTANSYASVNFGSSSLAAANSSVTTTNAYNVRINGGINAGTNEALTSSTGLYIVGNVLSGTIANSYGLQVAAGAGATANYAATFTGGNVGIGTTAPAAFFHIIAPGITGTPSSNGSVLRIANGTFTDNATAAGGTANSAVFGFISQPTLAATSTGVTTTFSESLRLNSAPVADTNESITNSIALRIATNPVNGAGTVTNSYGIYDAAPTGATNNYAAVFMGGNVGIGTTAPGGKLEVNSGAANAATGVIINTTSVGANTYEQYKANGTVIGSITSAAGASVAFNTTSDVRLKGGFQPVLSPLKTLNEIEVSNFYYLADPAQHRMDGFKAQQLYTVAPYAVTKPEKEVDENGQLVPWLADYSKVVPLVTAAVKELYTRVLGLESHQTTQDRNIASVATVAASKADKTEVASKADKSDVDTLKSENAAMKAWICAKDPSAAFCK